MHGSQHFSVTTAVALVLGGVAAMVLAILIVVGERGERRNSAPARGESSAPDATTGAARTVSSAGGEYLLDVSDATDPSGLLP